MRLHALRTETRLSTSAVAHYTRGELATALRKVRKKRLFKEEMVGVRFCSLRTHARTHARTHSLLLLTTTQRPYQCNLLVAGVDDPEPAPAAAEGTTPPATPAVGTPRLFWLDHLATMHPMNVAGTGYGSYFCLSMMDRHWKPDLTEGEALKLMEAAVAEVLTRLVVAPPAYVIKVVDASGIRTVKTIRPVPAGGAGGTGLGGGAGEVEMAAA